jgi:hypothetical protein
VQSTPTLPFIKGLVSRKGTLSSIVEIGCDNRIDFRVVVLHSLDIKFKELN